MDRSAGTWGDLWVHVGFSSEQERTGPQTHHTDDRGAHGSASLWTGQGPLLTHALLLQPHTQSLETLNLGHNPVGNEGVRNLKNGLIGNRSVLRLGLASTKLTCEGRARGGRRGLGRPGRWAASWVWARGQPLRSPSQARWRWRSSLPRAPAS